MVPSPLRTRAQASAVGQFLLRFTPARFLTVDAAFDAAGFGLGTVGSPIKRGMKKYRPATPFGLMRTLRAVRILHAANSTISLA